MRKFPTLPLLLIPAFFLFACSPAAMTASPGPADTPAATTTPVNMPCKILHIPSTPEALGAEFGDRGHVFGPADAPVTIVVFSDFQCTACATLAGSLKQVRLTHPTDLRLVYVNTPLSSRDKDALATQAVEAADLQGKYWEMHDLLFDQQVEWSVLTPSAFQGWVYKQAAGLGLDSAKFQSDFWGKTVSDRLQKTIQSSAGQSILPPLLFVNSSSAYSGMADFASLDTVVRMEALAARQFSRCPSWVINPLKQYVATLHTVKGDVVIQLFPDKAPMAVNNFVSLARSGWYDGITFYKLLAGFLVMTGDPSETGMGNPGYLFETEFSSSLRFNQPGMVAMDNSGPNTNGGRFLITLAPAPQLDGQYTIIGEVLSGMDVLSRLTLRDPKPGIFLPPGDKLMNVSIQEQ